MLFLQILINIFYLLKNNNLMQVPLKIMSPNFNIYIKGMDK